MKEQAFNLFYFVKNGVIEKLGVTVHQAENLLGFLAL